MRIKKCTAIILPLCVLLSSCATSSSNSIQEENHYKKKCEVEKDSNACYTFNVLKEKRETRNKKNALLIGIGAGALAVLAFLGLRAEAEKEEEERQKMIENAPRGNTYNRYYYGRPDDDQEKSKGGR